MHSRQRSPFQSSPPTPNLDPRQLDPTGEASSRYHTQGPSRATTSRHAAQLHASYVSSQSAAFVPGPGKTSTARNADQVPHRPTRRTTTSHTHRGRKMKQSNAHSSMYLSTITASVGKDERRKGTSTPRHHHHANPPQPIPARPHFIRIQACTPFIHHPCAHARE
jgi:hypothetical protein